MNKDQQKGNKLRPYSLFKLNFTMENIYTFGVEIKGEIYVNLELATIN